MLLVRELRGMRRKGRKPDSSRDTKIKEKKTYEKL